MWTLRKASTTAALVLTLGLALPAAASAGTKVYSGKAEIGGKVTLEVIVSKAGVAKWITELRAQDLPGTCEISGGPIPLDMNAPTNIKVSKQGEFGLKYTDEYDNKSTLSGKFEGKKDKRVSGAFRYASRYPAEGPYPEEDCATERTRFEGKKSNLDIGAPTRNWR